MEIIAGVVLSLTAAVVGVWRISARDRPIHGPPPDGQFTITNIQKWSDGARPRRFVGLRRVMPRYELSRFVLVLGLFFLAVVSIAGFFVIYQNQDSVPSTTTVDDRLGEIVSQHANANIATDPAIAYELLVQARDSTKAFMDEFPAEQVDPGVVQEYQSILNDLDLLTRVSRLESVQVVGGVPPAPSGVVPQLFSGGGKLFVLTDALYQIDTTSSRLVRLIGAGDVIGDREVGVLQGAAWRADGPLALDGQTSFVLDLPSGVWTVEPLGQSDEFPDIFVTAVDIFDFNLYILDGVNGRIVKYAGGDYESPPEDWTGGQASGDLVFGSDIVVDGNIYVSMTDGRILHFFLSNLNDVLLPEIVPPFEQTDALTANFEGQYFYEVNEVDGRIVRLDREGNLVQQFLTSPELANLSGINDIVVNEETGITFLLASNAIYTTRLSNPVESP